MGIYPNHGLIYRVIFADDSFETIVSQNDCNDRLVQSKYYQERKADWFGKHTWTRFVKQADGPVDIVLTIFEKINLDRCFEDLTKDVKWHGWCEENTLASTL
jgi:hypothetical protein